MINIERKTECCGCNACGDVCPKGAISFEKDNEGFWYPQVDRSKCVECGLCEKTCPVLHSAELKKNDVFIFPSKSEGLPRAVIEAMAVGLPCLSTPVGGIPELIDEEYLFDPLDEMGFTNAIKRFLWGYGIIFWKFKFNKTNKI